MPLKLTDHCKGHGQYDESGNGKISDGRIICGRNRQQIQSQTKQRQLIMIGVIEGYTNLYAYELFILFYLVGDCVFIMDEISQMSV